MLQLRLLLQIISLSESIAMPVRYAQHPAIACSSSRFALFAFGSSLQGFRLTRSVSSRRWLFLLATGILAFLNADKSARVAFPPRFKKHGATNQSVSQKLSLSAYPLTVNLRSFAISPHSSVADMVMGSDL
jgi:hypothetical protein